MKKLQLNILGSHFTTKQQESYLKKQGKEVDVDFNKIFEELQGDNLVTNKEEYNKLIMKVLNKLNIEITDSFLSGKEEVNVIGFSLNKKLSSRFYKKMKNMSEFRLGGDITIEHTYFFPTVSNFTLVDEAVDYKKNVLRLRNEYIPEETISTDVLHLEGEKYFNEDVTMEDMLSIVELEDVTYSFKKGFSNMFFALKNQSDLGKFESEYSNRLNGYTSFRNNILDGDKENKKDLLLLNLFSKMPILFTAEVVNRRGKEMLTIPTQENFARVLLANFLYTTKNLDNQKFNLSVIDKLMRNVSKNEELTSEQENMMAQYRETVLNVNK